jgi:hypothetical protein
VHASAPVPAGAARVVRIAPALPRPERRRLIRARVAVLTARVDLGYIRAPSLQLSLPS